MMASKTNTRSRLRKTGLHVKDWLQDQILAHVAYAHEQGIDPPESNDWIWPRTTTA
jgi:xylulose-5-phosphate/fructose-6-phosphate phosphoketolase